MPGVSQAQIEQARSVDLLTYMRTYEPQELVRKGQHEFCTCTHDSLRISDNGKWNWCSHGFGGKSALDYLIRGQGMDFVSAVRLLCEAQPAPVVFQQVTPSVVTANEIPLQPFALPEADKDFDAAAQYLRGRAIASRVLQTCSKEGLLYQTTRGGFRNCVFVGRDEAGVPRFACIRGCQGTFRGDVRSSDKRYAFCILATDAETVPVEVYEAPIDAMSGASIRLYEKKEDWRSVSYLAISGLNYMALEHFLGQHPGVRENTALPG